MNDSLDYNLTIAKAQGILQSVRMQMCSENTYKITIILQSYVHNSTSLI